MNLEISTQVLADLTTAARLEEKRADLLAQGQSVPPELERALSDTQPARLVAEGLLRRLERRGRA